MVRWLILWAVACTGCDGVLHLQTVSVLGDAQVDSAPAGVPAWVQTVVARTYTAGSSASVDIQANAAGDVLLLQLSCDSSGTNSATNVQLTTSAGWTWTPASVLHADGVEAARAFYAIAPDAAATSLDIAWQNSPCNSGLGALCDEFANVAFESGTGVASTGNPTETVTTGHADDVVWAAAAMQNEVMTVLPPLTPAANDGAGERTGYYISNDPAGTQIAVAMTNLTPTTSYVFDVVVLAPR